MLIISRILLLTLMIIIPLGFLTGIVILQVYLSKRESKWPGLILPMISFGMSMIIIIGIGLFSFATLESGVYNDAVSIEAQRIYPVAGQEGREIYRELSAPEVRHHLVDYGHIGGPGVFPVVIFIFLVFNIPTAILLIIYASCRDKHKRQLALDKMSLQDL